MTTPIDFETPIAQKFFKLERQLAMAELHLADKLTEGEKYHRWRAVKLAVQFLKSAVDAKVISEALLVDAIENDRCL
ncbi:MAG TPA: hypothetical protein PKZ32_14190 [Candidatus Melainabacteria bacterium]|jgi:hypothetical protein|nr:hypothetical protein [Candidatus Melainabacteria bacterium]